MRTGYRADSIETAMKINYAAKLIALNVIFWVISGIGVIIGSQGLTDCLGLAITTHFFTVAYLILYYGKMDWNRKVWLHICSEYWQTQRNLKVDFIPTTGGKVTIYYKYGLCWLPTDVTEANQNDALLKIREIRSAVIEPETLGVITL